MKPNPRFRLFKSLLAQSTGDKVTQGAGESIVIEANEFTPARRFPTLQAAIDSFARHLPVEFVHFRA